MGTIIDYSTAKKEITRKRKIKKFKSFDYSSVGSVLLTLFVLSIIMHFSNNLEPDFSRINPNDLRYSHATQEKF